MEFKVFIEKHPLARRVFGRQEIVIIRKQIAGIRLTQSEKNRLSRDIRPKLKFISEASKFKDEFDLKKGSENKKIVADVLRVIREDKDFRKVSEIWLFGSMVKNEMSVRSDVDVCVLFDEITKKKADDFRLRVLGWFSDKADVQVFNILPKKVRESILKSHRVLYRR
jgi:predicted nucleotidyltransferase